ncbi:hypothetical protein BY458DRAFT_533809 [Sporodiniella umbellata]|nr:hypothetical protein BY458DRAFT_533809 [Sporodiniella umbellata]
METFYRASSASFSHPDEDEAMQINGSTQKTGIDFKRKKNWPEKILVEITGLLHILSPYGSILYCSESSFQLTGYRPHELVGQRLVEFLHVDDMDIFIRDFQMSFHSQSQITTYYRFRKKDETYTLFEVVGRPRSRIAGKRPDAFYGMAQPIPSKNGSSLDTFLEVKAENEWLKSRIDELSEKYGKPAINHTENDIQQQLEITSISEPYTNNGYLTGSSQKHSRDATEESKAWLDYHKSEIDDMMEDVKEIHPNEELMDKKDRFCLQRLWHDIISRVAQGSSGTKDVRKKLFLFLEKTEFSL